MASMIKHTYSREAGPRWDFIGDVFPVDVAYPGARHIIHAASTHPDLRNTGTDHTFATKQNTNLNCE